MSQHSGRAQHIAPDAWYYEEKGGLDLYWASNGFTRLICRIPWQKVRSSLRRHDKKPAFRQRGQGTRGEEGR